MALIVAELVDGRCEVPSSEIFDAQTPCLMLCSRKSYLSLAPSLSRASHHLTSLIDGELDTNTLVRSRTLYGM